jgi:hypothetical protein
VFTAVGFCCDVVWWPPLWVFPGVGGWVNVTPIMTAAATLQLLRFSPSQGERES